MGTAVAGAANELRAALESEGLEFHQIGQMVAEPGLRFRTRENSLESMETSGWDHFR